MVSHVAMRPHPASSVLNTSYIYLPRRTGERWTLFRSLDIEAMTEGEYWMLLKGFVLLQRDASTKRFAAQRGAGFGNSHRHSAFIDKDKSDDSDNKKTFSETLPSKKTLFRKLFTNEQEEQQLTEEVQAPPSDYFLGYSSPGTQIWSRLRQAGLETQRVYALDTRKVMLKVRCPLIRLQDVAEALKIKLKTKDGEWRL